VEQDLEIMSWIEKVSGVAYVFIHYYTDIYFGTSSGD